MTSVFVTAATGQLGNHVVAGLLPDVQSGTITLTVGVRTLAKVPSEWSQKGVRTQVIDYTESADKWAEALKGVDRLLLISSSSGVGSERVKQHSNVIEGARKANVGLLAYTSLLNADTTTLMLGEDHKATEKFIKQSRVPYVLLRNGWYTENWLALSGGWKQTGTIFSAAGSAKFSPASRADYAAAAAAVLRPSFTKTNQAFELGGPSLTVDDIAAVASKAFGVPVVHKSLPPQEYIDGLVSHGLPPGFATILADAEVKAEKEDALYTDKNDLVKLIGREPTSYKHTLTNALTS